MCSRFIVYPLFFCFFCFFFFLFLLSFFVAKMLIPGLCVCSTDVNFIASQAIARGQQKPAGSTADDEKRDAMEALEREANAPVGFVTAKSTPQVASSVAAPGPPKPVNPDAIDLDVMEE